MKNPKLYRWLNHTHSALFQAFVAAYAAAQVFGCGADRIKPPHEKLLGSYTETGILATTASSVHQLFHCNVGNSNHYELRPMPWPQGTHFTDIAEYQGTVYALQQDRLTQLSSQGTEWLDLAKWESGKALDSDGHHHLFLGSENATHFLIQPEFHKLQKTKKLRKATEGNLVPNVVGQATDVLSVNDQWLLLAMKPTGENACSTLTLVHYGTNRQTHTLFWQVPRSGTLSPPLGIQGSANPAQLPDTPQEYVDVEAYSHCDINGLALNNSLEVSTEGTPQIIAFTQAGTLLQVEIKGWRTTLANSIPLDAILEVHATRLPLEQWNQPFTGAGNVRFNSNNNAEKPKETIPNGPAPNGSDDSLPSSPLPL